MHNFWYYLLMAIVWLLVIVGIATLVFVIWMSVENADNKITEGVVVDKDYIRAYTTYIKSGKTSIPVFHPESFKLCISGEKDGEIVEYWFTCPEHEYEAYNVGDYYGGKNDTNL